MTACEGADSSLDDAACADPSWKDGSWGGAAGTEPSCDHASSEDAFCAGESFDDAGKACASWERVSCEGGLCAAELDANVTPISADKLSAAKMSRGANGSVLDFLMDILSGLSKVMCGPAGRG